MIVEYTEKNEGNRSYTGAGSPFEIRDKQGRAYESNSRAVTALLLSGTKAGGRVAIMPELQPGLSHEETDVFEVPEANLRAGIALVTKDRALLSGDEVRIGVIFD